MKAKKKTVKRNRGAARAGSVVDSILSSAKPKKVNKRGPITHTCETEKNNGPITHMDEGEKPQAPLVTIQRVPCTLQIPGNYQAMTQDFAIKLSVEQDNVQYIQPLQDQVGRHFVVMFVPVSSLEQARAALNSDIPMPGAPEPDAEQGRTASVKELAGMLSVTTHRIRQLADEGIVIRAGTDKYFLLESVRAYVANLKRKADGAGLNEERSRMAKIQADMADLKLRTRQGELIETSAVETVLGRRNEIFKQKLLVIPSKLAPTVAVIDHPGQCQEVISDAIRECLDELSGLDASRLIDMPSK